MRRRVYFIPLTKDRLNIGDVFKSDLKYCIASSLDCNAYNFNKENFKITHWQPLEFLVVANRQPEVGELYYSNGNVATCIQDEVISSSCKTVIGIYPKKGDISTVSQSFIEELIKTPEIREIRIEYDYFKRKEVVNNLNELTCYLITKEEKDNREALEKHKALFQELFYYASEQGNDDYSKFESWFEQKLEESV